MSAPIISAATLTRIEDLQESYIAHTGIHTRSWRIPQSYVFQLLSPGRSSQLYTHQLQDYKQQS